MNKYVEVIPISRSDADTIIRGSDVKEIPLTLIRLAYHDPDWRWVQNLCIGLSNHKDKWVKRACVLCFSHLARIHRKLDRGKVDEVLSRLKDDPDVRGQVMDSIEELNVFLK